MFPALTKLGLFIHFWHTGVDMKKNYDVGRKRSITEE